MQYTALINVSGLCVNALASPSGAMLVPQPGEVTIEITQAQFDAMPVGKKWDGTEFVGPVQAVTMRQAKLALHAAGLLATVEAAISSLAEPARTVAQIEWNSGSVVERNAPTVALLAAAASLSESELDALFVQASTL